MKRKRGFTLVELLVVVAVIAMLMSILMPVLQKARDQAMRIICANHLRNQMLAIVMYADSHNNKIPQGGGYWPWDVSVDVTYQMLKNMGVDMTSLVSASVPIEFSTNFYCPANSPQKRYRDAYWNYSGSYRVLGYAYLWTAPWNNYGVDNILGLGTDYMTKDPSKRWINRTDVPQASEAELIVDATLSQYGSPYNDRVKWPKGNFTGVLVGGIGGAGVEDCTNHAVSDTKAAGGNIGFADNHVEWRPFTEMKLRFITPNNSTGGDPHWWW